MTAIDDHYPQDCPFCRIAAAYPPDAQVVPDSPDPDRVSPQCHLVLSTPHILAFLDIMPISPGHLLMIPRRHYEKMSSMHFSTQGATWTALREAKEAQIAAQKMGEFMPLLSRAVCAATGVEDWNVVQNNGARAAQVVPHVHYHLIPRYPEGYESQGRKGKVDVAALKSWKMFGRGQRDDLDDEEGAAMAASMRKELRKLLDEVGELHSVGKKYEKL